VIKKVFQLIQDGGWNEKIRQKAAILGSSKNFFFYKICVLPTPNECKKKIEKMLDTF
jgi:hypothetical protein